MASSLSMPEAKPWKTTLLLDADLREQLDEMATRIRRSTDYRPGASELVRAAVGAMVSKLRRERFSELEGLVGGRNSREAGPIVEDWLRKRLK